MSNLLKSGILFVVVACVTGFIYYFYHADLAHLFVRFGVISVPLLVLSMAVLSLLVGKLFRLPVFVSPKRKDVVEADGTKLQWSRVWLGFMVGLIIALPMIVVFGWLLSL